MNIIDKLKNRFFKKEFQIINVKKNKQSIILRDEKIINPKKQSFQQNIISDENGITHKLVLAINEKLSVYGVGEIASYEFNKQGELIMDLSLYKHKTRINTVSQNR